MPDSEPGFVDENDPDPGSGCSGLPAQQRSKFDGRQVRSADEGAVAPHQVFEQRRVRPQLAGGDTQRHGGIPRNFRNRRCSKMGAVERILIPTVPASRAEAARVDFSET